MRRGPNRRQQQGVALLIALVLVALATILATKLTFDGYIERRRAVGILAAEQAIQFGLGAEALAGDALTQTAQSGGGGQQFTLSQAWAQPTVPMPITPQDDPEGEPIGTIQGSLEDMQGRFNLNNLARLSPDGKTEDPQPLEQFQRLLTSLNINPKFAMMARDWIDADSIPGDPDGAEDAVYTMQTPPYLTGNWPMTSPTELMALPGFTADQYRLIAPYVTALPTALAPINICTASAVVLMSLAPNLSGEYTDQVLASGRKASGCFPDMASFRNVLGGTAAAALNGRIGTTSSYFRLTTHVTLGTSEFTLYSLLWLGRGGSKVTPLLRSFGTL
jgi:general secretion pathway protein K